MKSFHVLIAALMVCGATLASPGAHGPNGEHLDGPAAAAGAGSTPSVETFTETFELVGQLAGGELSILIDRYETNEPVLNGQLEVQYKNLKANAKFHADLGDYSIDDEKFLKAISVPGKHPLLFTFVAGEDSDLLEATLEVPSANHQHGDAPAWLLPIGAAAGVLILGAAAAIAIRRRKGKFQ